MKGRPRSNFIEGRLGGSNDSGTADTEEGSEYECEVNYPAPPPPPPYWLWYNLYSQLIESGTLGTSLPR